MSAGGSIGGLTPADSGAQPVAQPQPVGPQQPGYNQVTDYSLGFGRIFQQPSFFNPFAGYYGGGFGGSPYGGLGGFGGFGGGFGGFGGGFGGGLGSMYSSYPPLQFGAPMQVTPYRAPQPQNAYARSTPPTLPEPMPPPIQPTFGPNDLMGISPPRNRYGGGFAQPYNFGIPYVPPQGSFAPPELAPSGGPEREFGPRYLA